MRMGMLRPMNSNDMIAQPWRPILATRVRAPNRANAPEGIGGFGTQPAPPTARRGTSSSGASQRHSISSSLTHISPAGSASSANTKLAIGRGDASPVRSILLTDVAGSSPDQQIRAGCLEQ